MSVDKLVDSSQLDADLTSVANAIRTKGGTFASLAFPAGFVSAIGDIPTGGTPTCEMGTITLAAKTQELIIPVSQQYTYVMIIRFMKRADMTVTTGINILFMYGVSNSESDKWYVVGDNSNSGYGGFNIFDRTPSWRGDGFVCTATQIKAKALGNGTISDWTEGYTYAWAAWN